MEKGRVLRRPHFLSNCNSALEFLKSKKVEISTAFGLARFKKNDLVRFGNSGIGWFYFMRIAKKSF